MKELCQYLGVDGCLFGWISVELYKEKELEIRQFSSIEELWKQYNNAKLLLIDIPIGLKDKGSLPRLCDIAARKFLTNKRSSSIFPVPCRSAVYASNYFAANKINRNLTGKGLSKQTWNITGKIREVDSLLIENNEAKKIFIESHPEICFVALNNGKTMKYYKKNESGIKERLSILNLNSNFNISINDLEFQKTKMKNVKNDDILDAWILALSASKGKENLQFLPEKYEFDSKGLPMRITYSHLNL